MTTTTTMQRTLSILKQVCIFLMSAPTDKTASVSVSSTYTFTDSSHLHENKNNYSSMKSTISIKFINKLVKPKSTAKVIIQLKLIKVIIIYLYLNVICTCLVHPQWVRPSSAARWPLPVRLWVAEFHVSVWQSSTWDQALHSRSHRSWSLLHAGQIGT